MELDLKKINIRKIREDINLFIYQNMSFSLEEMKIINIVLLNYERWLQNAKVIISN